MYIINTAAEPNGLRFVGFTLLRSHPTKVMLRINEQISMSFQKFVKYKYF